MLRQALSALSAASSLAAAVDAVPLDHFVPSPKIRRLARLLSDPDVSEILCEGANRTSKTMGMAACLAGLASGHPAEWLPTPRHRWAGQIEVIHVVYNDDAARADSLKLFRSLLPIHMRTQINLQGSIRTITAGRVTIHTIGWGKSIEEARQRIAGKIAHLVWVNEECPPDLMSELASRGSGRSQVRVGTSTLGLEVKPEHLQKLDPSFFLERAEQGPQCDAPPGMCSHSTDPDPAFRHIVIPYDAPNTPWLTDRQREEHIKGLPEDTRQIRLGLARGRVVKGRIYDRFRADVHCREFTLADVAAEAPDPGNLELWLLVDCGKRDATAAGVLVADLRLCGACGGKGRRVCGKCHGGRVRGCLTCHGDGSNPCDPCQSTGTIPWLWVAGDYQSDSGSTTLDNAAGIKAVAEAAGIVGLDGAPDFRAGRWDRFVGDNMMAKQFPEYGKELTALQAKLGPQMVAPVPADKSRSKRWVAAQANHMLSNGRLTVHPRATRTVAMLTSWAWARQGADPKHDGPSGLSHTDAWFRYAITAACKGVARIV